MDSYHTKVISDLHDAIATCERASETCRRVSSKRLPVAPPVEEDEEPVPSTEPEWSSDDVTRFSGDELEET